MFLFRRDTDPFHLVYELKARQGARYGVSGQVSLLLHVGGAKLSMGQVKRIPGRKTINNLKYKQLPYNYSEQSLRGNVLIEKQLAFQLKMPIPVLPGESNPGSQVPEVELLPIQH